MNSIRTNNGDRLDLICWAHYGTLDGRTVEQVLEANPGISAAEELESGIVIVLPELESLPLERSLW